MPDSLDGGIFSGGALIDDDGTAYMAYWALPTDQSGGGVRIAKSSDRYYEKWEKFQTYLLAGTESGLVERTDEAGRLAFVQMPLFGPVPSKRTVTD